MTRRRYFVREASREVALEVERSADGRYLVKLAGTDREVEVSVLGTGATTALLAGNRPLEVFRLANGAVALHPTREELTVGARGGATARAASDGGDGGRVLTAPMPGRVIKLLVSEGATVSGGDALVVIEAMKMENELTAARAGVITRIHVRVGDTVDRDAPLVELG